MFDKQQQANLKMDYFYETDPQMYESLMAIIIEKTHEENGEGTISGSGHNSEKDPNMKMIHDKIKLVVGDMHDNSINHIKNNNNDQSDNWISFV